MNFIEALLHERLRGIDSTLDIFGSDHKVLQIACQDFTNFLKLHWNLIGRDEVEYKLVDKLEKYCKENLEELKEFLTIWIGLWFKKWKERVKLIIGNEKCNRWKKVARLLDDVEPLWRKLVNRQEMVEAIAATLIKNGEICGTTILAQNLIKMELNGKKRKSPTEEEQLLAVFSNSLKKARELAHSKGPLIFMKIDREYYHKK